MGVAGNDLRAGFINIISMRCWPLLLEAPGIMCPQLFFLFLFFLNPWNEAFVSILRVLLVLSRVDVILAKCSRTGYRVTFLSTKIRVKTWI